MDFQYIGQTVFKSLNKKKQAIFFSLLRKVFIVVPLTYMMPYMFHMGTAGAVSYTHLTLIVGQFLGEKALAAVGSSFTLMTFITSIILGLCMGSGALFSIRFGQRDENGLKEDICASFFFITAVTILLNIIAYISLSGLRNFLRVPDEVWGDMKEYLFVIFMGIPAVFLYNYFASYLRAIGNSVIPLDVYKRQAL